MFARSTNPPSSSTRHNDVTTAPSKSSISPNPIPKAHRCPPPARRPASAPSSSPPTSQADYEKTHPPPPRSAYDSARLPTISPPRTPTISVFAPPLPKSRPLINKEIAALIGVDGGPAVENSPRLLPFDEKYALGRPLHDATHTNTKRLAVPFRLSTTKPSSATTAQRLGRQVVAEMTARHDRRYLPVADNLSGTSSKSASPPFARTPPAARLPCPAH